MSDIPWHHKEPTPVSTTPQPQVKPTVVDTQAKYYVLQVAEAGPPTISKPLDSLQQVAAIVSDTPNTSWVLAFKGELVKLNATDALLSMVDGATKAGLTLPPDILAKLMEEYMPKFIGLTQPELDGDSVG